MTDNTIKAVVKRVIMNNNTNVKDNIHVLYEIQDMVFFSKEYWKQKIDKAENEIEKETYKKQMRKYSKMWEDMDKEIRWLE